GPEDPSARLLLRLELPAVLDVGPFVPGDDRIDASSDRRDQVAEVVPLRDVARDDGLPADVLARDQARRLLLDDVRDALDPDDRAGRRLEREPTHVFDRLARAR